MGNEKRKRLDNGVDEDVIIPSPALLSEMDERYIAFIKKLKRNIATRRISVALRANADVICQYWHIGKYILEQQERYGWGAKVIDRISFDLSKTFPGAKGFSPRNLTYMRRFAETWPDPAIVQQLVAKIPWCTNIILMEKLNDQEQRMWYAQQAIKNAWGRNILALQIESNAWERSNKAINDFEHSLCPHPSPTWPPKSSRPVLV
jgi:predicted nuclease of restriction endonuclease-like (RecB) superfamily